MPQNNSLPITRALYPLTRPYQKPPGITVSTTLQATYVPNKAPQASGGVLAADDDKPATSKSKSKK